MNARTVIAAPLMAAALVSAVAIPASAAPLSPQTQAVPAFTQAESSVTQVQWRRGGYYRGGGDWRNGRWIAPLIGGAIIGGAIASSRDGYYNRNYGERAYGYSGGGGDAAYERCAEQFRSFDPASGTYTTYDGRQVVCPYLR